MKDDINRLDPIDGWIANEMPADYKYTYNFTAATIIQLRLKYAAHI